MDVLITMCKSLLQQVSLVSGVLLQSAVHPWWSENVMKGVVEAWRQHLLLTDCSHLPGRMSQAKRPLLREKPMLVILDLAPLLPLEFPYHTQNVQRCWHIMVPFVRQPSEGKFSPPSPDQNEMNHIFLLFDVTNPAILHMDVTCASSQLSAFHQWQKMFMP